MIGSSRAVIWLQIQKCIVVVVVIVQVVGSVVNVHDRFVGDAFVQNADGELKPEYRQEFSRTS